jgi:hypothetical protein
MAIILRNNVDGLGADLGSCRAPVISKLSKHPLKGHGSESVHRMCPRVHTNGPVLQCTKAIPSFLRSNN